MLKTLILFLIIFSIIVVFHEYGHLYWAKRAGILVREFSLGMGPKLFANQAKDGTTYTVRMLPLGGYVRMAGLAEEESLEPGMEVGLTLDDQDQVTCINASKTQNSIEELPARLDALDLVEDMTVTVYPMGQDQAKTYHVALNADVIEPDGTRLKVAPKANRYESVSVMNKVLTNFGGPLNNFILSIVAFTLIAFLLPGIPQYTNQLGDILADSPAQTAGLQKGDKILAINDEQTPDWQALTQAIASHPNESIKIDFLRGDQKGQVQAQTKSQINSQGQEVGLLGINISHSTSVIDRIFYGFTATWNVVALVFASLATLFTKGFDLNMFGGPVAMAQATSQVANEGLVTIISFLAFLSTNLGIVNLLPIPALDGGKILLNAIEAVRGKPLSQEKEGLITMIGFVLLLILMLAVTWNDIRRAFF